MSCFESERIRVIENIKQNMRDENIYLKQKITFTTLNIYLIM